ncbi:MAG: hypothetical protein IPM13_18550 [Phycisphaerales bacterium]|nr:hypothetical protein [Phycisphaerales bacterium]
MRTWMKAALGVVVWAACAASAMAQTLTVPKNLTAGQTITIGYSDSRRAGETITVTIDSAGFPSMIVLERQITLDGNGNGSVEFFVPEWLVANFNAPGVNEVTRDIDLSEAPIFASSDSSATRE